MNLTDLQQFLTSFQENLDAKFGANASKDVDVLMNMTKITEEVGELAEQIMKYQGRQRDAKGDFDLTDLKDEVADVIIAASPTVSPADTVAPAVDSLTQTSNEFAEAFAVCESDPSTCDLNRDAVIA